MSTFEFPTLLVALLSGAVLQAAHGQSFSLDTFTVAGGSGTLTGGAFILSGTVGQPDGNLALSGGVFSLTGGFWSGVEAAPGTPLIVPGTANPWLAGMTNGFHEANGDVAPDDSPVLFANFSAGASLQFTAFGSAGYSSGLESGPEGVTGHLVNHGAEDGIGAIVNSPANALIGVFLDDSQPDPSAPTPDPFDFGSSDSRNYVTLQPALKQPFYIGAGTNASGLQQSVIVPANATRLFLGIQDGFGWFNNTGSFTVAVKPAATTSPSPAEVFYVVTGNNTIEKLTPDGVRFIFADTGLSGPNGLAFDSAGNLYVANNNNNTIEKFTPAGVPSVFASAGVNAPRGLAFDSAGSLYVSNTGDQTIWKFRPDGVGSVFANLGLSSVYGLAVDRSDNLYATGNNTIKRFTPDGSGAVFASTGLSNPLGMAFDHAGNLFVANGGDNTIRKFTPGGGASVFASTGLNLPLGLAFDSVGNLYAANYGNNTIEKFTPDGVGSLFAGEGLAGPTFIAFAPDSTGAPVSVAFDTNLILNPGAEAGAGSISGNDILSVPNWTTTNNFTVVVYDSSLSAGSPGPELGRNYFSGGPTTRADASNPFSSATQMIDVSALAGEIDAAKVVAELGGYFGGFGEQNDRARLTASYLDALGNNLGEMSVGDVLAVDRTNHTALLYRGGTNAVPTGTRKIQVVLGMTNESGAYYNDGYADNLYLVLRQGESPSTAIFDNTGGSNNGGISVSEIAWLAGKFCLGSDPYQLDSVRVLLNSQDVSGAAGPPASVQLQIYSNDAVSGKPSVTLGVVMNLAGRTNPITLLHGQELVEWTPAAPVTLSPNTCYWVVTSREGGGTIGEIGSFSMPTGAAATLGTARSADAGVTWGSDPSFNFKMLIQGTAIATPAPLPELAADGSTSIPGGTGTFASLPFAPSLSGDDSAFLGLGSGGQQGIYARNRNTGVSRVVDLNTAVPNGMGNFLSFGTQAGIIIVGGDILFNGLGSGSQQGIYFSSHLNPADPIRIADTATPVPSGLGTFTGFEHALGFDGSAAAFVGSGSDAQQGLYMVAAISPPQVGSPFRLADTTTAIPGGTGNFTGFPAGPALAGGEVAFIGNGSGAQQGLYKVAAISAPQVGAPLRVADTATAIPDGSGNFTSFGSDQAHPVDPAMSGDHLAFVGSGSAGQQGVYSVATLSAPQIGAPTRVADTATTIPGGSGNFSSFDAVSVSDTDTAFLGHGGGGQTGIYDLTGGQLRKVISVGESIQGKTIAALSFSRGGLFGDPIAFQATFSDGSQGVFTLDVIPSSPQLRITAVERFEDNVRLTFTSVAGQSYTVQSRADLSLGAWTSLAIPPTLSTGNTVQIRVPTAFGPPRQFYRIQVAP